MVTIKKIGELIVGLIFLAVGIFGLFYLSHRMTPRIMIGLVFSISMGLFLISFF